MLRGIAEQPEETPRPAPRQISQERQKITGLPLYFQGFLSVRHSRHQEFREYWTELRGTMLFFYDDKKAPTYSQKLDISTLTSATNVYPDENGSAQFILMLPSGELELKANNCECGKEWKGFILTVTKLSVPQDASLLPGQLTRMHEVLEKEKKRRITLTDCSRASLNRKSPPSSTLTAMPVCFYAVSRQEATEMLEKNPSCGNLILRPGSDSKNYAVSIRQELDFCRASEQEASETPGMTFALLSVSKLKQEKTNPATHLHAPCLKHYKVTSKGTSYIIELERQVRVPSLQDVVNYFVSQTQGNLKPFVI